MGTNGVRDYEDTLYLGSYEREIHSSAPNSSSSPTVTKTIHRHTLGGIGVYTKKVVPSSGGDVTTVKLTTVLKDHLGSTSVLYTGTWNASTSAFANAEIENQSFNPWGERRDAATLANFRVTDSDAFRTSAQDYDRGYTGHEQLDDSGLIHMNGRIYDPEIGRFLSPDPFVQVPEYSQNFNRYSYVMNNPLNAVDPSGFSWVSDVFHKMGSFLQQNWRSIASIVFALAMTYATGGLASPVAAGIITGATTGAFDAAINGGNSDAIWRGALVSAVQGGISSGILHPIGAAAADSGNVGLYGLHIVGHGLLGGAANEAMGGKFQDGFISAAVSTAASDMGLNSFIKGDEIGGRAGRTVMAGIIGGTASEVGGGKFSNGFYTAAFQHLLNNEAVMTGAAVGGGGMMLGEVVLGILSTPVVVGTAAVAGGFAIGAVIGDYVGKSIGRALNPLPQNVAADIAPGIKYAGELNRCVEFADGLSKVLTKRKINNQILVYDSQPLERNQLNGFIVPSYGAFKDRPISMNGHHEGVLVGSMVFDNHTPSGVPLSLWLSGHEQLDMREYREKPIATYVTEGRATLSRR